MNHVSVASCQLPVASKRAGIHWQLATNNWQLYLFILLFVAAGCASPDKANITLRKQNAGLQNQVDSLTHRNQVLTAQIAGLQQPGNTVSTLPLARLDLLFTTHGLDIYSLSAAADLYHENHGQTGIRLYVSPLDEMGNPIQSTGTFSIEAYDLAVPDNPHLGHWTITPIQCKESWTLGFLRAAYYRFDLPYQQLPQHATVTLHVKFMDELTGRIFTAQHIVDVQPSNSRLLKPQEPSAQAK